MQTTYKNFNFNFSFKHFGFLLLLIAVLQGCYVTQPAYQPVVQREVVPPPWAPEYQNPSRVQYYYMPDIETYYDVWNHEYIYLENGNWVFEPGLPPMYSGYDLYSGHIVVLNYDARDPWRHHELYSSHYPKYYYHSVHNGENGEHSTGYDENTNQNYYGSRTNSRVPNGNNPRTNTNNAPTPAGGSRTNTSNPPTPTGGSRTNTSNPPTGGSRTNTNNVPNQPRTNPSTEPNGREKPVYNPNEVKPAKQEPAPQPRKTQPVQYQEKSVGRPVKVQKNSPRPKAPAPNNTAEPKRENR